MQCLGPSYSANSYHCSSSCGGAVLSHLRLCLPVCGRVRGGDARHAHQRVQGPRGGSPLREGRVQGPRGVSPVLDGTVFDAFFGRVVGWSIQVQVLSPLELCRSFYPVSVAVTRLLRTECRSGLSWHMSAIAAGWLCWACLAALCLPKSSAPGPCQR